MDASERDVELVAALVERWNTTRAWAEQLLVDSLGLEEPRYVLEAPHRGHRSIPGTPWWYRTHGTGVDVSQPKNVGGIDFDFDQASPDEWRLRVFLVKQYNAGALKKSDYRPLLQDEDRWLAAVARLFDSETETVGDSDRTFMGGNANPWKYGISFRASSGESPQPKEIARAATLLDREPFYTDDQGFECEMFAAAVHPDGQRIVYVESRARPGETLIEITIKVHYVDGKGKMSSVDIESYNPFFGCDVGMIEWVTDDDALLIYREKHWTFVYRIGAKWPPPFVKIESRWSIKNHVLSFMGYKADVVQRLQIPSLEPLDSISVSQAEADGSLPPDLYT